ncbi:MAG: S8 family serine peptidase, partial [Bacteroidota bacterium]
QLALLKQLGIINGFSFKSLPMVGAIVTPSQISALAKNSEIRSIYLNRQLSYYNFVATHLTGVYRLRADKVITAKNNGIPVSGKGITVLVNDSGVDGTHADLQFGSHLIQNVNGSTNPHAYSDLLPIVYLENIPNNDNNSGHGTHVAGIVGATGSKSAGKYMGVAPGANLIGYGSGAALFILDGLGGFDYAITNQFLYGIRVVTNSWGTSGTFDPYDPINIATKLAYDRGIVVLFAAGNSGPGENTHNPYAIAPWVISVAAGVKNGDLADFSSRGVKGQTGTFQIDGETWTYENRPTITAPGVDIISTRVVAPVSSLGATTDVNLIEPAYLPFYTTMSGTSMATPHTAGIVALMLEANRSLSPAQVKDILQKTATNMPAYESWENGAGYVNAYAAVDYAMNNRNYNSLSNIYQQFNSSVGKNVSRENFSIDYNPVPASSATNNSYTFNVANGLSAIEVRVDLYGALDTGNPVNLVLISPDGKEYSSGVPILFAITYDRTIAITNPVAGTWKVVLRGLRGATANPTDGAGVPEQVNGYVKYVTFMGYTGLNDIGGHPAEAAIKLAVSSRLVDSYAGGFYMPDAQLTRIDLAKYLMMGQAIRQYYPTDGVFRFSDVSSNDALLVESVTNKGAAIKDKLHLYKGVMFQTSDGIFSPDANVYRLDIVYSLVQSLGLQGRADSLNGTQVKVNYNGQQIILDDNDDIPANLRGYVQIALDLNMINVYYSLTQGPYDLVPTMHASFRPNQAVTRGDFAVLITRTFTQWKQLAKESGSNSVSVVPTEFKLEQNYPNPFNPSTTINYTVAKQGPVNLEVYNIVGQKVATLVNANQPAGNYSVKFDAGKLASGIYIYRISTNGFVKALKMNLMK